MCKEEFSWHSQVGTLCVRVRAVRVCAIVRCGKRRVTPHATVVHPASMLCRGGQIRRVLQTVKDTSGEVQKRVLAADKANVRTGLGYHLLAEVTGDKLSPHVIGLPPGHQIMDGLYLCQFLPRKRRTRSC